MKSIQFRNRHAQQIRTGLIAALTERGRTADGGFTDAAITGAELAEPLQMERKHLHRAVENLNMALLEQRADWRIQWDRSFATGYTYRVTPRVFARANSC